MFKLFVLSSVVMVSTFLAKATVACDISGVWSHAQKPATLMVDLVKGEVSVHSHDNNEKGIGLVVLKSLELGATPSSWKAKMYSAPQDSFVDVQVLAKNCQQLIVRYKEEEVLKLLR